MYDGQNGLSDRYQLRYAAGQYWLLSMEQKGIPYQPPVVLNAIGAWIWDKTQKGQGMEAIARGLAAEYEIPEKEALTDVKQFYGQLGAQGIAVEDKLV